MADHIPDPAKHRTLFYGHYANRAGGELHADPLTCRNCGAKLEIVAYLHDTLAIKQILDHLGLSPPQEPKPPPAPREVLRVPLNEGWEIEAP